MDVNDYQRKAQRTHNPELTQEQSLLNGLMGLCGEAGEAIDILKKSLMQGAELDEEHLIKELGDVAWYLAEAATALNVPLDEILQRNIKKLESRYPDGFNVERSANRVSGDI